MRDPVTEHHHSLGAPVKCGSDTEMWLCELESLATHNGDDGGRDVALAANDSSMQTQTMDIELQLGDSGLHATISATPQTFGAFSAVAGNLSQMQDSSSEKSLMYKRKLGLPGADVVELRQRKRQCVNMEDEHNAMDSTSTSPHKQLDCSH